MSVPTEAPSPAPATFSEKAAWLFMAAALVFVFHFHLVPALVAGLLVFTLLHKTTGMLHGPRLSHITAKVLSAVILSTIAAGIVIGAVVVLFGFVKGRVGDLPALFEKLAEVVDQLRARLASMGADSLIPESAADAEELKVAVAAWLKGHSSELTKTGAEAGRLLVHALMGVVVGLLVFFAHPEASHRPLASALSERVKRFWSAFEMIVTAQVEISAINAALTAVYLFGILSIVNSRLPFSGTLVAVTFVVGLIPVIGNLISNSVIVLLSLSVSPWIALASLLFLVVIHKLEYFVNARIVGSKIHAASWEILLVIISAEVAFGVPGVVLAPVLYAYVKRELGDRGLI